MLIPSTSCVIDFGAVRFLLPRNSSSMSFHTCILSISVPSISNMTPFMSLSTVSRLTAFEFSSAAFILQFVSISLTPLRLSVSLSVRRRYCPGFKSKSSCSVPIEILLRYVTRQPAAMNILFIWWNFPSLIVITASSADINLSFAGFV